MENDMAIQKIKLKIGTVYQKEPNGICYFRYQVNGARKAISLKTRNKQQAIKEAEQEILSMTTSELCYILDEMAVLLYCKRRFEQLFANCLHTIQFKCV